MRNVLPRHFLKLFYYLLNSKVSPHNPHPSPLEEAALGEFPHGQLHPRSLTISNLSEMQVLRLPLYISTLTTRGVLAPRSDVYCLGEGKGDNRPETVTFIAIGLYVQLLLLLLLLLSSQVMSDSLRSHGQQPTRLPCPSPSPRVCWSSCPLSWWCCMSIELVMPLNHLILCLSLLLLPSIFPKIKVFSNESALHIRWPKYWSFSFSISPSKAYSELISFKIDWLLFMGFSRQKYWSGFPFPSPVDHVLSELSTMTVHLGWPCTAWLIVSLT